MEAEEKKEEVGKTKDGLGRFLRKVVFLLVIVFTLITGSGLVIAFYYGTEVKSFVIGELNKQLNTKVVVDPSHIHFSVLRHFPSASVEFDEVLLGDTLAYAGSISLEFNLKDVFSKNYRINELSLSGLNVKIRIGKDGEDNFHFWKKQADSTGNRFSFSLEKIKMNDVELSYVDLQRQSSVVLKIPKGTLSGKFSDKIYDLSSDLELAILDIESSGRVLMKDKKAELRSDLSVDSRSGIYTVSIGKLKLARMNLDVQGQVFYKKSKTEYDKGVTEFDKGITELNLQLKGKDLDIVSLVSLLPESVREKMKPYSSEGTAYFEATVRGKSDETDFPEIDARFGVQKGEIMQKSSALKFRDVKIKGDYTSKGTGKLNLETFSGRLDQGELSGKGSLENFSHPELDLNLAANIDLGNFQKFLALDTIELLEGNALLKFEYKGGIPQGKNVQGFVEEDLSHIKTSGNLELSKVRLKFKNSKNVFDSVGGSFEFNNRDIVVNNCNGRLMKSDFELSGLVTNMLPFLFSEKQNLTIEARLKCDKLDLDELLSDKAIGEKSDTAYLLKFSPYLHLNIKAKVGNLNFRRFDASQVNAHVVLEDRRMLIDPVSFKAMNGHVNGGGEIDARGTNRVVISGSVSLEKVDIGKLFGGLENFGQSTLTDKNLKGLLTSTIQFSSEWDAHLKVREDKIEAKAEVKIEKGELLMFAPLKAFSRFINLSELEDIKFATLENQIEIRNRMIYLPKMELKNNVLNLNCSGKHTFDNDIDYQISLKMRELLAKKAEKAKKENDEFAETEDDGLSRTLFIAMTGTVDHPVFKYSRKGLLAKIKEDIKNEKHSLKGILRDEFGWFKKDSTLNKKPVQPQQKKSSGTKVKWDESGKDESKDE